MDIQISVPRETISSQNPTITAQDVAKLKKSICSTRNIQGKRLKKQGLFTNSEIDYRSIDALCTTEPKAENLLKQAINAKSLSLRAYHKIKKIARTIADLEQSEHIQEHHVAEAVSLRINEKISYL